MTVFDLKVGESAKVKCVAGEGPATERLRSLGLKEGVRVKALAFSLFNGGILVAFDEVRVGIRKNLAKMIEVEREGQG